MNGDLTNALVAEAVEAALVAADGSIGLVGYTPEALGVRRALEGLGLGGRVVGIFDPAYPDGDTSASPWNAIAELAPHILVICADADKERLLKATAIALRDLEDFPRVVLAGTAHLEFEDEVYRQLDTPAMVPSYATGYSYTRQHLFQCLRAASFNGLAGAIVEFGSFKGGTTAWLARAARRLGLAGPIIGFDSWAGFPPRRSLLDLYAHDRCVFSDVDAVRAYLEPLGVELVVGDIHDTAPARLLGVPVLVAFVDTDNYSPAVAALRAVVDNLVVGGSIVFDHFHTTAEYVYTVGERLAAKEILFESGLLQLHGTGVFTRIAPVYPARIDR